MQLLYDQRDLAYAKKRGDLRLMWLNEVGAIPVQQLPTHAEGFLFGYQLPREEYDIIVRAYPKVRDRAEDREQLARLEDILLALDGAAIQVPTPRTWVLGIDDSVPTDLTFPLFVRTSTSSWKRGGQISKVRNFKQLEDECELLRRAFRWDATILAREWLDLAPAGEWRYGPVPREIRVWIVDGTPLVWSFHYLHAVKCPKSFPPSTAELETVAQLAREVAKPFASRMIATDFVCDVNGKWHFLEAGPGACSGTAHEGVFKAVALALTGSVADLASDEVGGYLPGAH